VSEFAKELDRNLIKLEASIGGGTVLNIVLCEKNIKSLPIYDVLFKKRAGVFY
jgi:hypothetical protein